MMDRSFDHDSIAMARDLLRSIGMGHSVSKNTKPYLDDICNGRSIYDSKNDIYQCVVDMLKGLNSQEARILLFEAFKNMPVSYRSDLFQVGSAIINHARNKNELLSSKYQLGLSYYKNNNLIEAEKLLSEAYEGDPSNFLYCRWLAEVYVKMNDIDKALSLLYAYKRSPYYKPLVHTYGLFEPSVDNTPIAYINAAIKEIENKKARGYVFRARKNKVKSP